MIHNRNAYDNNNKILKILVLLAYLLMITVNILANALPINGVTTGEVSGAYPNLFAPAAITFSIWGLIYLLLAGFVVYQLGFLQSGSRTSDLNLNKIRLYFILSSVANAAWIIAWQYYKIPITVILMLLLLVCLIVINNELYNTKLNRRENLFVKLPFRVYLAWITIATIANITIFLVSIGWNGFGISEVIWTILIIGVGFIISLITMLHYEDIAYGLVILWAYAGILIKHISPNGFDGKYPSIIIAVIACMILLVIAIIYLIFKKKKSA